MATAHQVGGGAGSEKPHSRRAGASLVATTRVSNVCFDGRVLSPSSVQAKIIPKWLESYLVRRMLCGYASNELNKTLMAAIQDTTAGNLESGLVRRLTNRDRNSGHWPNDAVVIGELTTAGMRGSAACKKMVLTAVGQHMRQPMGEQLSDAGDLTIEHVMPQSWETNWVMPADTDDMPAAINQRKQAIQQIGNLTLTTEEMNAHLSNGPWAKKREEVRKISTLTMNREIAEHETWDEETIAQRSRRLGGVQESSAGYGLIQTSQSKKCSRRWTSTPRGRRSSGRRSLTRTVAALPTRRSCNLQQAAACEQR